MDEQFYCVRQRAGKLVKEYRGTIPPRYAPSDTDEDRRCKADLKKQRRTVLNRESTDRLELMIALMGAQRSVSTAAAMNTTARFVILTLSMLVKLMRSALWLFLRSRKPVSLKRSAMAVPREKNPVRRAAQTIKSAGRTKPRSRLKK